MKSTAMKLTSIIAFATGILFSNTTLALGDSFEVKVFPLHGKAVVLENFSAADNEWVHYFRVQKVISEFSNFKPLEFEKIHVIERIATSVWEINLKDGHNDFYFISRTIVRGYFQSKQWRFAIADTAKIEFKRGEGKRDKFSDVFSHMYDRIILKEGDVIGGKIYTEIFKLRTPFASETLYVEEEKIKNIDFKGMHVRDGKKEMDVVLVLKSGDRISGVLETYSITIILRTGTRINVNYDNIARITFSG